MAYSNIEKFDEIVGRVFSRTYVNFPVPVSLHVEFLVGEGRGFDLLNGEMKALNDEGDFAFATVEWLVNAGFISASKNEQMLEFNGAVLTIKGLEALKQIPGSLKASIGEEIDAAVRKGSIDASRTLVAKALGFGLQVILNSTVPQSHH